MGATQLLLNEAVSSGKGRTLLPMTLQRASRCEGIGRSLDAMPSLYPGVPSQNPHEEKGVFSGWEETDIGSCLRVRRMIQGGRNPQPHPAEKRPKHSARRSTITLTPMILLKACRNEAI